jgi:hypothetical protein
MALTIGPSPSPAGQSEPRRPPGAFFPTCGLRLPSVPR